MSVAADITRVIIILFHRKEDGYSIKLKLMYIDDKIYIQLYIAYTVLGRYQLEFECLEMVHHT